MALKPAVTALLTSLVLVGCANPANNVPALEVALTAADQTALKYITLPLCPQPAGALCSDAQISAQIKAAGATAYAAVKAARAGSGTSAIAESAIAAFVSTIPVK